MRKQILCSCLLILSCNVFADTLQTAAHFNAIKNDSKKLYAFLHEMPKGGDLHIHETGATMVEDMLAYAQHDNLCLDEQTFVVSTNTKCPAADLLSTAIKNKSIKQKIIDAWSMQDFKSGKESGHDHFFNAFAKFIALASLHFNDINREVVERAGEENILYIEPMVTPDNNASGKLGLKVGWNSDFATLRKNLLNAHLDDIVNSISAVTNDAEKDLQKKLHCGTSAAKSGCNVHVKYLYQALREQPKEAVFAQLLTGFELAKRDPNYVGINLVQPEDGKISMRDYTLQMQMIQYLHQVYPDVKISLHAGELTPSLVPLAGLRFHIRQAIEIAHANRIGHGVDITYEDNYKNLLREMAAKHILVEINLTSNQYILNVEGKNHPLPLYLNYNVPVALSTDDEGVNRSSLTLQFENAVNTYHFSYDTLKTFVRNSIAYSFVPGESLWADYAYTNFVNPCLQDLVNSPKLSASCQTFLQHSQKASLQWELEKEFQQFEKPFHSTKSS